MLVGIARLAAESELLEAKRRVQYFELPTRSFIGRCSSEKMPFEWTINPYRGCEFGCKYCYARYTHEFMELRQAEDFETQIYAKQWNPQAFRKELRQVPREDWIALGTATDCYQPAERRYGIMRSMLEIFSGEKGRRLSITTKSDLVARDAALLSEIARSNVISVNMTITTVDETLARSLEPFAPRPSLRLEAVSEIARAGAQVGVFIHPVLPGINDSLQSMAAVAEAAKHAGATYLSAAVVFLKPCAQQVLYPWLDRNFPHLAARYRQKFTESHYLRGAYPDMIRERLHLLRDRFALGRSVIEYQPEQWSGDPQLTLF